MTTSHHSPRLSRRALLGLGLAALATGPRPTRAQSGSSCLLVGWDGARRDVVQDRLTRGELPTLAALLADGASWHDLTVTEQVEMGLPTNTKPGWAQVLTGQPWSVTGVKANTDWQVVPREMTLPAAWQAAGGLGLWLTGKQNNCGYSTTFGAPRENWCHHAVAGCDYVYQHDKISAAMEDRMLRAWLAQAWGLPTFAFLHFQEPDQSGHLYGWASEQYASALRGVDGALGRILAVLPAGWRVVITTEHGFDDVPQDARAGTHYAAPDVWAVCWPPQALGGRLLDLHGALLP